VRYDSGVRYDEEDNTTNQGSKQTMSTNHVSATLSDADKTAALAAVETAKTKLPFLVDLSPDERHALPKMGDRSVAFVNAALTLVQQNPSVVPGAFNVAEFQKDVALLNGLGEVAAVVAQFNELVEDTMLAVGTDAYTAALIVYQSAKMAGKGQGLDALLDSMGQRFARKSKGAAAPQPPAP
jgi:hypothetical protein